MALYKEQLLKIDAYRDMVKHAMSKNQGYYTDSVVMDIVNKIDLRYSILSHTTVSEGSNFDTEAWNEEAFALYTDICILYKTLLVYEQQELKRIQYKAQNYVSSIRVMAEKCQQINAMHTASTSMGKTLYFQDNRFDPSIDEETAVVTLDSLSVTPGTELIFHINGNGFEPSSSYCKIFINDEEVKRLSPYYYDGDSYTVTGDTVTTEHTYTADDSIKYYNIFAFPNITADINNNYLCYAGKNAISIIDVLSNYVESESVIKNKNYAVDSGKKVRFYVKNGTVMNMDFSVLPTKRNFTETNITSLPKSAVFEFTTDTYTRFSFDTDGEVWAEIIAPEVKDDKLYVTSYSAQKDYIVVEEKPVSNTKISKMEVVIPVEDLDSFKIKSIAIKSITRK